MPSANGLASGPATASQSEGAMGLSTGNSSAKPTSLTNPAASSIEPSRSTGNHRRPRAPANADPSTPPIPGTLVSQLGQWRVPGSGTGALLFGPAPEDQICSSESSTHPSQD